MHINQWLLVRHEGKVLKGIVVKIYDEDLDIKLEDETVIQRKFWEVRGITYEKEEK